MYNTLDWLQLWLINMMDIGNWISLENVDKFPYEEDMQMKSVTQHGCHVLVDTENVLLVFYLY